MSNRQLYINNILCDLPDSSPVAITFQINDLANLEDRQSTYTNNIKLPKSQTNCKALGYANIDAFTQNEPYENNPCKYVEGGVEVIPYGTAILQAVSDFFEVQLLFGVAGLNDSLDDVNIRDLDFTEFDHPFTATGIGQSQTATEGYLWPVMDMGVLDTSARIDIRYLRPAFFTKTIIQKIAGLAGYSLSGMILNDSYYRSELVTALEETAPALPGSVNMPDISAKDFLKDVMQRYFLTPEVDNYKKKLIFHSFDEVYNNIPNAKDWTAKFINDARTDNFTLPGYAQQNKLIYKDVGAIRVDPDGYIVVNNKTLENSKTIVTSKLSGISRKENLLGGLTVAYADLKTEDLNGNIKSTNSRVMYNRLVGLSGFFDFYNGIDTYLSNGISTPYFYDDAISGLPWSQLIERYGQGLVNMLDKARVITRYALLSVEDVYNFDFFTPVFDRIEGKYYYVNQITNWQPNKKVKVNLIRL